MPLLRWLMRTGGGLLVLGLTLGLTPATVALALGLPEAQHRADLHLALAVHYFQADQNAVALEEVDQSLLAQPQNAEAHSLRGVIEWRLHHAVSATASFQTSLALQPNNLLVLQNAAWWQCQQGQADAAQPYFDAALAQSVGDSVLRLWLARAACQRQAGQNGAAQASYLQVLALAERRPPAQEAGQLTRQRWVWEAHRALAEIMAGDGDFVSASPYIRQVNESGWADAATLWLGVRIERGLGRPDADDEWLDRLHRQFPQAREPAPPF